MSEDSVTFTHNNVTINISMPKGAGDAKLTPIQIQALTWQIQRKLFEQAERNRKPSAAGWTREVIDDARVTEAPELERIVVAVVPGMPGHTMGVVVAGRAPDGHVYILGDYSVAGGPAECVERAVAAYRDHMADEIAGMVNDAGDYLEKMLRLVNGAVHYKAIHAFRDLALRAKSAIALYEQGCVHHVGTFASLESRMAAWKVHTYGTEAQVSALVCAITELESR